MKIFSKVKTKLKGKTKSASNAKAEEAQAQTSAQADLNLGTSTNHLPQPTEALQAPPAIETDAISTSTAVVSPGPRLASAGADESSVTVQTSQVLPGEVSSTSPLEGVAELTSDHQNETSRKESPRNSQHNEPDNDIAPLPESPSVPEPEDLWNRAYELLRHENEGLVTTYEEILESKASTLGSSTPKV